MYETQSEEKETIFKP